MTKKIGVVGGGVFGCTISVKLAEAGFEVLLFEKENNILKGGTSGSILRLHSGAHYPRHLPTAIQSRKGMKSFIETYSDAIYEDFPNYYATMRHGSKVNFKEYELFLNKAKINFSKIEFEELISLGMDTSNLTGIWRVREGVIDLDKLRQILNERIKANKVSLSLNTKVVEVIRKSSGYQVLTESHNEEISIDAVVFADYGANEVIFESSMAKPFTLEYQLTAILEFQTEIDPIGITLVDGDFLTMLPQGFRKNFFLAYGPQPSVIKRLISHNRLGMDQIPVEQWEESFISKIRERIEENFSGLNITGERVITGFRSIPALVQDTDQRPSLLRNLDTGVYQLVSGKIDHAVDLSSQLIQKLKLAK